jgi:hypothetical protein
VNYIEIKHKTKGTFKVFFDEEDTNIVESYSWRVKIKQGSQNYYAACNIVIDGKRTVRYMHQLFLSDAKYVDHINRNSLDNRRENLRSITPTQNSQNAKKRKKPSTSKFKGVHWHKRSRTWYATITTDYKQNHLGSFKVEEDAAKAYNEAAIKYFGEFAVLNTLGEEQ